MLQNVLLLRALQGDSANWLFRQALQPSLKWFYPTISRLTVSRRLRFSGQVGRADIEVRGPPSVSVTIDEKICQVEIVTSDSRIKIDLKDSCDK